MTEDLVLTMAAGATWQVGYRPTKLLVIYTCDTPPMYELGVGKMPNGDEYGKTLNYVTNTEMAITCTDDIERLNLYGYCGNLKIYGIYFQE